MINRKIFVLASVGLFGSLLPLFDLPNRALAGCGFLDITCNPRQWDSPTKTIRNNINPPMPQRRSEIYESFTLINQSNEPLSVAYGEYIPMRSSSGGGSTSSLAVMTHPYWVSKGWWSVNPGESKVVYETQTKGKSIYIRITSKSGVKVPAQFERIAEFCVSNQAYSSQTEEAEPHSRFSLTIDGQSKRGSSCEQIGGHLESFWQMKAHTNFTINQ
ncbi:DUF1036 domain-containing protein [Microcoleus sp. B4-C5]|uniref:DUF1036 domain-containing protein n=1 Tax=unclassified Microcoleus TaxID=2642155 RepID=UPI002FCF9789